LTKATTSKLL